MLQKQLKLEELISRHKAVSSGRGLPLADLMAIGPAKPMAHQVQTIFDKASNDSQRETAAYWACDLQTDSDGTGNREHYFDIKPLLELVATNPCPRRPIYSFRRRHTTSRKLSTKYYHPIRLQ
jgi:hypothetical protein